MSPRLASRMSVTSGYCRGCRCTAAPAPAPRPGGEVGDLRLERAHEVGGGVDDRPAERIDGVVRRRSSGLGNDAGSGSRPTHSIEREAVHDRSSCSWKPHGVRGSAQGLAVVAARVIAPVGHRSAASFTLSCQLRPDFSWRMYRYPSLRTSNTSGHTCMHVPVDAHTSKSTTTFTTFSFALPSGSLRTIGFSSFFVPLCSSCRLAGLHSPSGLGSDGIRRPRRPRHSCSSGRPWCARTSGHRARGRCRTWHLDRVPLWAGAVDRLAPPLGGRAHFEQRRASGAGSAAQAVSTVSVVSVRWLASTRLARCGAATRSIRQPPPQRSQRARTACAAMSSCVATVARPPRGGSAISSCRAQRAGVRRPSSTARSDAVVMLGSVPMPQRDRRRRR